MRGDTELSLSPVPDELAELRAKVERLTGQRDALLAVCVDMVKEYGNASMAVIDEHDVDRIRAAIEKAKAKGPTP